MSDDIDTDRRRLRDAIARQCAYNGHTYKDGKPPDDAFMSDIYGADWPSAFAVDAKNIVAAIEAAGFALVATERLGALERLARDAEATAEAGARPPALTHAEVAAIRAILGDAWRRVPAAAPGNPRPTGPKPGAP